MGRDPAAGTVLWQAGVMPTRPAMYRRRGPEGRVSLGRLLDARAAAVNRRLRAARAPSVIAAAAVPVAVGLIAVRRRIGLHPAVTLVLGCGPPLGLADALLQGAHLPRAVGHLAAEEADLLLEVGDLAEQRGDVTLPPCPRLVGTIA